MATETDQSLVFAILAPLGRQVQVNGFQITTIEIIHKAREVDILIAKVKTVLATCTQLGITEQTYYRWPEEYGGMDVSSPALQVCNRCWAPPAVAL